MSKKIYTQNWLESSPSDPATTDGERLHDEDEEGFAAQLYSLCRIVLGGFCSQEHGSSSRRLQSVLLREELAKLYLWGQSFAPGELDTAVDYSDDVRYLVLDALGDIGRSLLRGKISEISEIYLLEIHFDSWYYSSRTDVGFAEVSRLSSSELKPVRAQQSHELKDLVEQTKIITANRGGEEEEVVDDDEAGGDDGYEPEEDSTSDDEQTSDIVQELETHIHCLVELGPTLQQNLLHARKTRIKSSYPPIVPFRLSDPAAIYVSLVREKFKNAQDQLVDRLGESNWQRHKAVREQMKTLPEENDIVKDKDQDGLYSIFRSYSTFYDSGIGTSVPADTQYALSHTSFQSSNTEGKQGSLRVPPTPEEVKSGKPFQCAFCGQVILNIKNRIDWKSVTPNSFIVTAD